MYCSHCSVSFKGRELMSEECPYCQGPLADEVASGPMAKRKVVVTGTIPVVSTLTWGIVVLIISGICFLLIGPKLEESRSGLGQLAVCLDPAYASAVQMWELIYYGSIIGMIVGSVMIIGGIVSKSAQIAQK